MTRTALAEILEEARVLLAREDNDFGWSGWHGRADALAEIDAILARIGAGEPIRPASIELLFLPTGPLQEVSLSSGWGDRFLALADRFDQAISDL